MYILILFRDPHIGGYISVGFVEDKTQIQMDQIAFISVFEKPKN